ncbi:cell division cycle-associated protein 7-like [Aplochiton taeniatus]
MVSSPKQQSAIIIPSLTKKLADIFKDDSENDRTFYGFTESELSYSFDKNSEAEDTVESKKTSLSTTHHFRLRVALRSRPPVHYSTEEEESDSEIKQEEKQMVTKNKGKVIKNERAKKKRIVKSEVNEKPLELPSPLKSHSDSENEEPFLVKRDQNIKANKAMLAQLMADLVKMPGAEGLLKKRAVKQQKDQGPRPPRSAKRESGSNPEQVPRRQTRSMGRGEDSSAPQEKQLELSLEEELLEVRGTPRRRSNPRPFQSKPHVIRLVEEITNEEIQLVADSMTEKIYNQNTGSTCHQCRQKTIDTKTCCRSDDCRGIQGQFCGPCLRNRYGEDVKKALLDPEWQCPPCRGICNCSFCRARDGRCPTGILFPLAQYHGFSDVHSYLSSLRHKMKDLN